MTTTSATPVDSLASDELSGTTEAPTSDDFLAAFVREATGNPDAKPRPGQQQAFRGAVAALQGKTDFLASCPTGSGKSAIALAAAAYQAVVAGERTLISTESLSLMRQVIGKDGPAMIRAVETLTGRQLTIGVRKGVSNYVDPRRLFDTANQLAGTKGEWDADTLISKLSTPRPLPSAFAGVDVRATRLINLVQWGLLEYQDDSLSGDRDSYEGEHTTAEWAFVSAASTGQASKKDDTPYLPKAVAARMDASEAAIVVTNHTLLAIQAATGTPIVNGSSAVGLFENIIVDEAHALPGEVRARGAARVSPRTMTSLIRAVAKVAEGKAVDSWTADGVALADRTAQVLKTHLPTSGAARLPESTNPLDGVEDDLVAWVGRAPDLVRPAMRSTVTATLLDAIRVVERCDEIRAAVNAVREHRFGQARWVQKDGDEVIAESSPVDVSSKIRSNLWTVTDEDDVPFKLGVVCMSATLPASFQFESGASTPVAEFLSPFDTAYANSALYIPAVVSGNADRWVPALTSDRYGKRKFDTANHALWATHQIVQLVEANHGSALILAAKSADGKAYAEALRAELPAGITVYSQWDGATPASLLARWRDDHSSVLVGTRSLMTGVDAPGQTCSLVILDRVPRSPSNPLDDARLEDVMARLACDNWAADRFVYAADAALLLRQAAGRLIRSVDDTGMFCVLDPRLVRTKVGAAAGIAYPEPTRLVYTSPLRSFPNVITDIGDASTWLTKNRAAAARDAA